MGFPGVFVVVVIGRYGIRGRIGDVNGCLVRSDRDRLGLGADLDLIGLPGLLVAVAIGVAVPELMSATWAAHPAGRACTSCGTPPSRLMPRTDRHGRPWEMILDSRAATRAPAASVVLAWWTLLPGSACSPTCCV